MFASLLSFLLHSVYIPGLFLFFHLIFFQFGHSWLNRVQWDLNSMVLNLTINLN